MELQNLLANHWDAENETFDDYIIQMFVEHNGKFNYTFFNQVNETKFTHSEINAVLENLSGNKVVPYTECKEAGIGEIATVFKAFKAMYKFGEFLNAREWIRTVYDQTDVVLPRPLVLNWIATQRPDRVANSFAPINDGNLYHASEKEHFSKPNKRADSADAE